MKKIIFSALIFSSVLISSGCKDDAFDPKGEFKDKYILTCVLRSDTTVQMAVLSGSYNVEGFNPMENNSDPAIENADIRLWLGDSVYVFKAGEAPRTDTSRYNSTLKYYYAENTKLYSQRKAEIVAVLQNGRKLHSITTIPKPTSGEASNMDETIPPAGRNYILLSWYPDSNPKTFYYPRFSLIYFKIENGVPVRYVKRLPVRYVNAGGGKFAPVYATPTNNTSYVIEMDAINRTMQEISAGDPNKKNYVILTVLAEIMTMDESLSAYYSASKTFDNGFTIKLDQTDYSNIEGGLGVFASFANTKFAIRPDRDYIKSFGYKTKLGPE